MGYDRKHTTLRLPKPNWTLLKIVLIIVLNVVLLDTWISHHVTSRETPVSPTEAGAEGGESSTPRKILLYNSWWGIPDWEVGLGQAPFHRLGCPVTNCVITNDKSRLNTSDAVLFHIEELQGDPPAKLPGQRFVFFMLESPGYSKNMRYTEAQWRDKFDWTMTYRLDSDIRLRYGNIARRSPGRPVTSVPTSKTGLVAWIVSNCGTSSEREAYVRELSKHVRVDVYGRCGNLTCAKDWRDKDATCLNMLGDKYLFYIAFENSFCADYVTEKFFKVLSLHVVPIVRGAADYRKYTPHVWHIDSRDFPQPTQLADRLRHLAAHPAEYLRYFAGREHYRSTAYFGIRELYAWCELCEKLQDPDARTRGAVTRYKDMSTWWSRDRDCHPPRDFTWRK